MSLILSGSLYIFIGVCFQRSASHPLHQKTQAVSAILKIEQVRQEVKKLLSSAAASHMYVKCCLIIWQAWLGHVWSLSWIQGVLKTTCSPILYEKRETGSYHYPSSLAPPSCMGTQHEDDDASFFFFFSITARASNCVLLHVHAIRWLGSLEHCEFEQYSILVVLHSPGFSSLMHIGVRELTTSIG